MRKYTLVDKATGEETEAVPRETGVQGVFFTATERCFAFWANVRCADEADD